MKVFERRFFVFLTNTICHVTEIITTTSSVRHDGCFIDSALTRIHQKRNRITGINLHLRPQHRITHKRQLMYNNL
ncbi:unnamed protein product [Rotaria socialis]